MTTYYKVTVDGVPGYEAGEVLARCEATSRRQALQKLRIDESNLHLVDAVPASKMYSNVYDPRLLT